MNKETLNKTKHTPGPWKVEGPNLNRKDSFVFSIYSGTEVKPKWIADISFYSDHGTPQEKANAKLIAAAPELLEALQSLLAPVTSAGQLSFTMLKAEEAIKKATE